MGNQVLAFGMGFSLLLAAQPTWAQVTGNTASLEREKQEFFLRNRSRILKQAANVIKKDFADRTLSFPVGKVKAFRCERDLLDPPASLRGCTFFFTSPVRGQAETILQTSFVGVDLIPTSGVSRAGNRNFEIKVTNSNPVFVGSASTLPPLKSGFLRARSPQELQYAFQVTDTQEEDLVEDFTERSVDNCSQVQDLPDSRAADVVTKCYTYLADRFQGEVKIQYQLSPNRQWIMGVRGVGFGGNF